MNFFRRIKCVNSADCSRVAATTTCHLCGGGFEGAIRRTADISRASRHAVVSIRQFLGCFPPAMSADYLQNLQQFSH